jgi:hypothetical protein
MSMVAERTNLRNSRLDPTVQVGASLQTITPEQAQEWLDSSTYELQRGVRPYHVKRLAAAILAGEFEPELIKFKVLNQRLILVNGQHRLQAIVAANTPAQMYVAFEHAETEAAVAQSYRALDSGLSRSMMDKMATSDIAKSIGLSGRASVTVGAAVALIARGLSSTRTRADEVWQGSFEARLRSINRWADEAYQFHEILRQGKGMLKTRLEVAPVQAIALITLRHQNEKATEFWSRVARDQISDTEGLINCTGEKQLVDYVMSHHSRGVDSNHFARVVSFCWNAYYENRRLNNLKGINWLNKENPVRIAGTPFTGRVTPTEIDDVMADIAAVLNRAA